MKRRTSHLALGAATAMTLCLTATAGWSLSAEEAWNKWQELTASGGEDVSVTTGSASGSGGTYTVTDYVLSMQSDEFSGSFTIPEIKFTENGDDVDVTMSPESSMTFDVTPASGEVVKVEFGISTNDLLMTASDAGGGTQFTYSVPSTVMTLTELVVEDEKIDMSGQFTANNSVGTYTVGTQTPPAIEQTFSMGEVTVDVSAKEPEGSGTFDVDISIADLSGTSNSVGMPLFGMDMGDMDKMLKDGFSSTGSFLFGATTAKIAFSADGESFNGDMTSDGGTIAAQMDQDKLVYDVAYNAFTGKFSGSEIPFPQVTVAMAGSNTNIMMPLQQTDTAQPFVMNMGIDGLSVGEEIWAMIDPGAVLPRDPATLIINLAGQARWLINIFDENSFMSADVPAELDALSINEIRLAIGGADLSATGGFTFDNSDLETFGGMPRPAGTLNLLLKGGNGLLDKLVQMGLVPDDQAMMARMMTGMLAKPGEGPDELVSEIQITPDGKILANGAPLPF